MGGATMTEGEEAVRSPPFASTGWATGRREDVVAADPHRHRQQLGAERGLLGGLLDLDQRPLHRRQAVAQGHVVGVPLRCVRGDRLGIRTKTK